MDRNKFSNIYVSTAKTQSRRATENAEKKEKQKCKEITLIPPNSQKISVNSVAKNSFCSGVIYGKGSKVALNFARIMEFRMTHVTKIEKDLSKPEYIETVFGVGYRFRAE